MLVVAVVAQIYFQPLWVVLAEEELEKIQMPMEVMEQSILEAEVEVEAAVLMLAGLAVKVLLLLSGDFNNGLLYRT
jgi:hypothetical protein